MNTSKILLSIIVASLLGSNVIAMDCIVSREELAPEQQATQNLVDALKTTNDKVKLITEPGKIQKYLELATKGFAGFKDTHVNHPYITGSIYAVVVGGPTVYFVWKNGYVGKIGSWTSKQAKKAWKFTKEHPYKTTGTLSTVSGLAGAGYYFRNSLLHNRVTGYLADKAPSMQNVKDGLNSTYEWVTNNKIKTGAGVTGTILTLGALNKSYHWYFKEKQAKQSKASAVVANNQTPNSTWLGSIKNRVKKVTTPVTSLFTHNKAEEEAAKKAAEELAKKEAAEKAKLAEIAQKAKEGNAAKNAFIGFLKNTQNMPVKTIETPSFASPAQIAAIKLFNEAIKKNSENYRIKAITSMSQVLAKAKNTQSLTFTEVANEYNKLINVFTK